MGAMSNCLEAIYVGWEELVASGEKGRREIHYFLKRRGGRRDLMVVGKENSVGNMVYDYAIHDIRLPVLNRVSGLKPRSRREVVDWLNSIVSDGELSASSRLSCVGRVSTAKTRMKKDTRISFFNHHIPGFAWLGSSWSCQKRRHHESFCRNSSVISIQDFVYVLSDESKRLIAYLEDMYEDFHGNKLVLVRWFHKIDEVGFDLPINYNDREIFFTLCLQEISVECIDGLATVLSPAHCEKLNQEAAVMGIVPFVCYRQCDNDDVNPFDVTSIEGYWKQELLKKKGSLLGAIESRPNKRNHRSFDDCMCWKFLQKKLSNDTSFMAFEGSVLSRKGGVLNRTKYGNSRRPLPREDNSIKPKFQEFLTLGSCIEVLSQDSGIRGCWFRASIIKKHKDKVKIKYHDVKDAVDDSKKLEEWISPSRIAAQDASGIRLCGRLSTRPAQLDEGTVCHSLYIGSIVDAWWHDGWWEGIVVKGESSDKITVHFPGDNREAVFALKDLRHSKEWFQNCWQDMDDRPEIASKYCSKDALSDTLTMSAAMNDALPKPGASMDLRKDHSLPQWISSGRKGSSGAAILSRHIPVQLP